MIKLNKFKSRRGTPYNQKECEDFDSSPPSVRSTTLLYVILKNSYFFQDFQIAVSFCFWKLEKVFGIQDYVLLNISSNPACFCDLEMLGNPP